VRRELLSTGALGRADLGGGIELVLLTQWGFHVFVDKNKSLHDYQTSFPCVSGGDVRRISGLFQNQSEGDQGLPGSMQQLEGPHETEAETG